MKYVCEVMHAVLIWRQSDDDKEVLIDNMMFNEVEDADNYIEKYKQDHPNDKFKHSISQEIKLLGRVQ